jgi:hypothetical protein
MKTGDFFYLPSHVDKHQTRSQLEIKLLNVNYLLQTGGDMELNQT